MVTPTTESIDGTARNAQPVLAPPKARDGALARILLRPRNLLILSTAAVTAGAFLNWQWLVAAGVAPIILAVLPCAIMCALGVCMMPKRRGSDDKDAAGIGTTQRSLPPQPMPDARDPTK